VGDVAHGRERNGGIRHISRHRARLRLDGMRGLAAILLLGAGSLWASPACVYGTLSSYLALGTEGCRFQGDGTIIFTEAIAFRSFGYSGDANGIWVSPDFKPWAPGLKLFGFQAGSGEAIDARLTFEVDAPAESAGLVMNGLSGDVAAEQSVCVGAPFGADGSCAGRMEAMLANGPRAVFPATQMLGVTDSFVVGAGASAVYFGSDISRPDPYGFCECGFAGGEPVPEPGTAWLLSAGLMLLAPWRRCPRTGGGRRAGT
jgi:hypothetical protein